MGQAKGPLPDVPIAAAEIKNIVLRGGILLTVYPSLPAELQQDLKNAYLPAVKQSVLQDYEGQRILQGLGEAGLDCIALKGWDLRQLYPDITMRQMADLDILVRPYSYGLIKKVMLELGFRAECAAESSWMHDNFGKDEVNVELHKRLSDDSGVIQKWEKQIWQRAACTQDHIFKMSPEDHYVFHFIHLHKDFLNGSLGLRRIIDTWLLQKQDFDRSAVLTAFEQMGLTAFHENMIRLSRACMGEIPVDDRCEVLLRHAFRFGIYGTDVSYKAGRIAAMSSGSMAAGKIRSFMRAVFLPYRRMKAQFPVLEKWPILLPFCWFRRIAHLMRGGLKDKKRKLDYRHIDRADYDEMKAFFEAGGC